MMIPCFSQKKEERQNCFFISSTLLLASSVLSSGAKPYSAHVMFALNN